MGWGGGGSKSRPETSGHGSAATAAGIPKVRGESAPRPMAWKLTDRRTGVGEPADEDQVLYTEPSNACSPKLPAPKLRRLSLRPRGSTRGRPIMRSGCRRGCLRECKRVAAVSRSFGVLFFSVKIRASED